MNSNGIQNEKLKQSKAQRFSNLKYFPGERYQSLRIFVFQFAIGASTHQLCSIFCRLQNIRKSQKRAVWISKEDVG